ncbi:sensor histidine kinase [Pseudonocardia sp. HH130629-09]|uniref:sensor histidine kinase n=1 Tax=Pseudonocardia sp. HH130629-09 TaxID=1641402 RepID=UPI0006CB6922|nr:histidine kinase [Pseudonocardia sp. HH130629-09]ALE84499.1 hypothetical protein XF36_16270 [Pseudonocardia sp. HH130629-09]
MCAVNGSVAATPNTSIVTGQYGRHARRCGARATSAGLGDVRRKGAHAPDPESETRRAGAARQHLAGALHDEIGPLLFAIAAGTQRARALHGDDAAELRRTLDTISDQVLAASDRMREILAAAAPADPAEAVPAAIERDLVDLRSRSSLDVRLVVRGFARRLTARQEAAVLTCARQGLYNIERHAGATRVVVTLTYSPETVTLVVLDDGRGVGTGPGLSAVPDGGNRWGSASMRREAEQNGGEISLRDVEDGTALRLRLPV